MKIEEEIAWLKNIGLYRQHEYLGGYTEKVEAYLADGDLDKAERFTLAFFVRRKWTSKQAEPYIPSVVFFISKVPTLAARIDAYYDPERPIE